MAEIEPEIVATLWNRFFPTGEWPLVDDLANEFDDQNLDFEALAKRMPGILLTKDVDGERARLTLDTILSLPEGRELLEPLPKAIALARNSFIDRGPVFLDDPEKAFVNEPDLLALWKDPIRAARFLQVVTENHWMIPIGGWGGLPGTRKFYPSIDVLRYKHARTLDDCLKIRRSRQRSDIGQHPSGNHLELLKRIYAKSQTLGKWPPALQFVFDNLDLGDILQFIDDLGDFISDVRVQERHSRLELRQRSIPSLDSSGELRNNLFGILRAVAGHWKRERMAPMSLGRLAEETGIPVDRLPGLLLFLDHGVFRGMQVSRDSVPQSVLVDRTILPFRHIEKLEDFLKAVGAVPDDARGFQEAVVGALAGTPTEGQPAPAQVSLDLTFMKEERLRRAVEEDLQEINLSAGAGACRAAAVLLGSALEAVLFDVLDRRRDIAASYLKKGSWPERAAIKPMLDALKDAGLLDKAAAAAAEAVKDYRDLIHPYRRLQEKQVIDDELIGSLANLLASVARSLRNAMHDGRLARFESD